MLDTTRSTIKHAGRRLGLNEDLVENFLKPDAEHSFTITLASGKQFPAYRVQHNHHRGPYKGGIRLHPDVNLDEVRALATLMSLKTAVFELALGGGKGGVSVDPRTLSEGELEELSRAYVKYLEPHIGPFRDIPAPDINTNARIMDWMVDEYKKLTGDTSKASFTGKSFSGGGSVGRMEATGVGGVLALSSYLKLTGEDSSPLTVAVQGFGNVGGVFASAAAIEEPHWRLVAASDSSAGLYSASGLNAQALSDLKSSRQKFSDFHSNNTIHFPPDELPAQDVDVLVLAAVGDVMTAVNVNEVKARLILELANGPIDQFAAGALNDRGVVILPDIIANGGGVCVSYMEWKQNHGGERWSLQRVNDELADYMNTAVSRTVESAKQHSVPLKDAAFMNALSNLL